MGKPKLKTNKPLKTSLKGITKRKHSRKSGAITPKLKNAKLSDLINIAGDLSSLSSPEQDVTEIISDSEEEFHRSFVTAPNNPINFDQLQSGIGALFEYVAHVDSNKLKLLDEEQPIFLQITTVKVPRSPSRFIRFNLKHSLFSDTSDICLIVEDIGKPKEHEETIEHFENLLREKGVDFVKTVMPFNQFKNEYGKEFEMKRRLLGLYDCFLVDARISGPVIHLVGKVFMAKRKIPTPVRMNVDNLKKHLEKAVNKTLMDFHSKGDTYVVQVGHTHMTPEAVFENVCGIVDQLHSMFPGGLDNIRALGVKTDLSINVPVFLTLKNKNEVGVPILHPKRPKNFKNVTDELSTYTNRDVTVLPTGEVITADKGSQRAEAETPQSKANNSSKRRQKGFKAEEDVPEKKMKNEEEDNEDEVEKEDELDEDEFLEEAEAQYLNEYEQEHVENKKVTRNTEKTPKASKKTPNEEKENKAKKRIKKDINVEEKKQSTQRPRKGQKVNGVNPKSEAEPEGKSAQKTTRGRKLKTENVSEKVNGLNPKPEAEPEGNSAQKTTRGRKLKTDNVSEKVNGVNPKPEDKSAQKTARGRKLKTDNVSEKVNGVNPKPEAESEGKSAQKTTRGRKLKTDNVSEKEVKASKSKRNAQNKNLLKVERKSDYKSKRK